MNLQLLLATAIRSLRHHKGRAVLTTLGIIIGVVAIVCVMSIGEGAKYKINKEIEKLGSNFIVVISAPQKKLGGRTQGMLPTLKQADYEALKRQCHQIDLITPSLQIASKVTYERTHWRTILSSANEHYLDIRNWNLAMGRFFTPEDLRAKSKVAVLGHGLYKELFGTQDPLGKKIRMRKRLFTIIGVIEPQGKRPDGTDEDDVVLIPITTMVTKIRKGTPRYLAFVIAAKSKEVMPRAAIEIRQILRQSRRLKENEDDDFTVFTQADIASASDAAAKVLNLLLLIIASISLIVGGIGIMNIMLVTVTERTREIGLRMAIGATTQKILTQFLLEAVIICLLGGLIGASIGIIGAKTIGLALGWPTVVSIKSVLISLCSSVVIGVGFGYYPAWKAARLSPVEALIER